MLSSVRSTPKVSTLTSRYDPSRLRESPNISIIKRVSKTLRSSPTNMKKSNTNSLSQSRGI